MTKTIKNDLGLLANLLGLFKNKKDIKHFLTDILSVAEIRDLAKRIKIAQLLHQGELSYKEIAKTLKSSTTTVTRVAHWLNHGQGGLRKIISKIEKAQK